MEKAMMLKAAWIFLILSIAMLAFTFRYFHYSKENGLLGTEYQDYQAVRKHALRSARSELAVCFDSIFRACNAAKLIKKRIGGFDNDRQRINLFFKKN